MVNTRNQLSQFQDNLDELTSKLYVFIKKSDPADLSKNIVNFLQKYKDATWWRWRKQAILDLKNAVDNFLNQNEKTMVEIIWNFFTPDDWCYKSANNIFLHELLEQMPGYDVSKKLSEAGAQRLYELFLMHAKEQKIEEDRQKEKENELKKINVDIKVQKMQLQNHAHDIEKVYQPSGKIHKLDQNPNMQNVRESLTTIFGNRTKQLPKLNKKIIENYPVSIENKKIEKMEEEKELSFAEVKLRLNTFFEGRNKPRQDIQKCSADTKEYERPQA